MARLRPILVGSAALAALAGVLALVSRPAAPPPPTGPAFQVRVVKPRTARPLLGLLPEALEQRLEEDHPGMTHGTPGARLGWDGPRTLDIRAEGWHLRLVLGAEGQALPGTELTFPMRIGGRIRHLRSRFGPGSRGALHLRPAPEGLSGRFAVELGPCEEAATGRPVAWPPAPLRVEGGFRGMPAAGPSG